MHRRIIPPIALATETAVRAPADAAPRTRSSAMTRPVYFSLALFVAAACASTGSSSGDPVDAGAADAPRDPDREVCDNGIDDDGDDEIDEACPCAPGEERSCYEGEPELAGVGVCTRGIQTCERMIGDDGELSVTGWGGCEGSGQPSPAGEECDGADDDCDGEVDEDCPPVDTTCGTPCAGVVHVIYNATYDRWIQVVLCSAQRYDLLMGDSEAGPFYKIGDGAGHGQDHCELVNPTFTIPDEDDINSGTCSTCAVASAGSVANNPELYLMPMYYRSVFGEPFAFDPTIDAPGIWTSCWYQCGVEF